EPCLPRSAGPKGRYLRRYQDHALGLLVCRRSLHVLLRSHEPHRDDAPTPHGKGSPRPCPKEGRTTGTFGPRHRDGRGDHLGLLHDPELLRTASVDRDMKAWALMNGEEVERHVLETYGIAPGQIYLDNDPRETGRRIKVLGVKTKATKASCATCDRDGRTLGSKTLWISFKRLSTKRLYTRIENPAEG